MATRRCFAALIHRRARSLLTSTTSFDPLKTLIPQPFDLPVLSPPSIPLLGSRELQCFEPLRFCSARYFSSKNSSSGDVDDDVDSDEEEEEDDDEDEEDESDPDDEDDGAPASKVVHQQGKTEAEKVEEAAEIGYKVIGHLGPSEFPFKAYEPVFAVVQVGSHQFKVCNGDSIFTEKLKYCDVNDKLILTKVLMLGSNNQTVIGRPILPEAAVHAVVEEHALDAKVIIFKKKRRKNYRRTKGHRQELTKLRITDIQGIDKSDIVRSRRKKKAKPENEAVAA